jgi:DNA-binding MarR family transcriptional regulator
MSPTLLSRRLKQLEAEGVIERRPAPNGRGSTYHLTPAGEEFVPLVVALGTWGQRWARRELAEKEIDLGLLVWALERGADPAAFGKKRSLVRLELTDQPPHKRLWWFLNEDGRCTLCLDDPGFEAELYLSGTLPDLIYIVRGDLPIPTALETGRLEALGTARARRALTAWFNLGPLTAVEPARAETAA